MTRLRKDQTEDLLIALDSATSGPLEEITMVRERLVVALRVVLDRPAAGWAELVAAAADLDRWDDSRIAPLQQAAAPDRASDPEEVLWVLWDLVTELSERRALGGLSP